MKKALLVIIAGLIGGQLPALADIERASKLTPLQKQQIAWALKILGETKTLTVKDSQCVQLDQDILNALDSEGQIEQGGTRPNTICIGPTQ